MELSGVADKIIVYGTACFVGALGGILLGELLSFLGRVTGKGISKLWRKRHPKKGQ